MYYAQPQEFHGSSSFLVNSTAKHHAYQMVIKTVGSRPHFEILIFILPLPYIESFIDTIQSFYAQQQRII